MANEFHHLRKIFSVGYFINSNTQRIFPIRKLTRAKKCGTAID
jgi:hypothetical protein